MSFNKITIVGYLGRDPELRYTPQGTAVCKLSVATTERKKNVAGQPEEHTTWFRVTVWGRQAELANEYLARGRQVYLEGRLRLEEFTDREGHQRISPEVNANDIQFLGQRGEASAPSGQNGALNERNAEQSHQTVEIRPEEEEEEEARPAPPRPSGKAARKKEAPAKELVS